MTTGANSVVTHHRPATHDHRLGFSTQDRETVSDRLPVEGDIPPWLTGTLLRAGPGRFEVGAQRYRHWFDGLAMLHRFGFGSGSVSYANRFLKTRAYRAAEETGRISYREFATDPCRTLFQRLVSVFSARATDNAAVNVVQLGDEYLALTDPAMPVAFAPGTLRTLGVTGSASALRSMRGQLSTAHPHHDHERGELVTYVTHFGPRSRYRVYTLAPRSDAPRELATLPVRNPSYMHSFALTERYVVLVEFPFVVSALKLALSGRPFIENYRWEPDRGTTFLVIDRRDGTLRARVAGPAFFAFHHVNAFEDGGELVVDLCAYDDASLIEALYLDRLRSGEALAARPELRRYRVPLTGGDAHGERLVEEPMELPRIDYRAHNGRRYRYAYAAGLTDGAGFADRLVKADVESGSFSVWCEPGCYPGEPVFVPAPDQAREDDGVILSVVLDAAHESSYLLILDASTLEERARAHAPQRIPFGFHGSYFRDLASVHGQ
jgi:beta,beta-carotene 9',10'-dioxygenase